MTSSEKISVYSLADLKNTSDDAIPNYLNSLKFRQSHTLVDTRLALGYSAFAISAACFAWDYKLGWDATKNYTAVAVGLYMVVNAALTLWVTFWEKSIVYQGTSPSGEKISISTTTKKNVPIYNVHVRTTTSDGKKIETSFEQPFSQWFNAEGLFIARPFQQMFATSAPVIGKFDAANFKTDSHKLAEMSPDVLDALMGDHKETSASTTATETKRKTRSRKA
jgi:signal peptidase complex subunit 2